MTHLADHDYEYTPGDRTTPTNERQAIEELSAFSGSQARREHLDEVRVEGAHMGTEVNINTGDTTYARSDLSNGRGDVKPFKDELELSEAWEARTDQGRLRVEVDPAYRKQLERRIAASAGFNDHFSEEVTFAPDTSPQDPKGRRGRDRAKIGRSSSQPLPFRSQDAMVKALDNPKYETDAAYRAKVDARIGASSNDVF